MKITANELMKMVGGQGNLKRYSVIVGYFPAWPSNCSYDGAYYDNFEIDNDVSQQIAKLHFAERATGDLRAMGEGMGRLSVNVPSNINVWSHARGETQLASAAKALTDAVEVLAKR